MIKISGKSKAIIKGLLEYLDETKRNELLPEVTQSLERKVALREGTDEIIVTSVVKLTPKQIINFKTALRIILKVNLPLINKIDQNLIGGFTIQINDWFLDSSISYKIELLKRSLLA